MVLGMVDEKVYYRYLGEHRQRQGHLGESREDMTRLNWATWEGEGGKEEWEYRGTRYQEPQKRVDKNKGKNNIKKGQVTKIIGVYREGQLGEWEGQLLGWRSLGKGQPGGPGDR